MQRIARFFVGGFLLVYTLLAMATDFTITLYNDDYAGAKTSYSVSTVRHFYSNPIAIADVQDAQHASAVWNVIDGNDAYIRLGISDINNNTIMRIEFMAAATTEPVLVRTTTVESFSDEYTIIIDPPADLRLKDTRNLTIHVERRHSHNHST